MFPSRNLAFDADVGVFELLISIGADYSALRARCDLFLDVLNVPQLGIQPVAQPIPQQVHRQNGQHKATNGSFKCRLIDMFFLQVRMRFRCR